MLWCLSSCHHYFVSSIALSTDLPVHGTSVFHDSGYLRQENLLVPLWEGWRWLKSGKIIQKGKVTRPHLNKPKLATQSKGNLPEASKVYIFIGSIEPKHFHNSSPMICHISILQKRKLKLGRVGWPSWVLKQSLCVLTEGTKSSSPKCPCPLPPLPGEAYLHSFNFNTHPFPEVRPSLLTTFSGKPPYLWSFLQITFPVGIR